jgi:predicted methyltransferase
VRYTNDQIKQAWRTYHYEFGLNVIPVGHNKIFDLAVEAHTDQNFKERLADYLQTDPAQVLEALRGYLKLPTFSSEIRRLLGTFIPHYAEKAVNSIPSLSSVTDIRKSDDKNSYAHFYDQRIDDPVAEKLIKTYGDMATGLAVLLRESDRVVVVDFDNRQALIELLSQLGEHCDETNLEQTLASCLSQKSYRRNLSWVSPILL